MSQPEPASSLLGQYLRRARDARDLSREELCARVGISLYTIKSWESGPTTSIPADGVAKIARALGLDGNDVLAAALEERDPTVDMLSVEPPVLERRRRQAAKDLAFAANEIDEALQRVRIIARDLGVTTEEPDSGSDPSPTEAAKATAQQATSQLSRAESEAGPPPAQDEPPHPRSA